MLYLVLKMGNRRAENAHGHALPAAVRASGEPRQYATNRHRRSGSRRAHAAFPQLCRLRQPAQVHRPACRRHRRRRRRLPARLLELRRRHRPARPRHSLAVRPLRPRSILRPLPRRGRRQPYGDHAHRAGVRLRLRQAHHSGRRYGRPHRHRPPNSLSHP